MCAFCKGEERIERVYEIGENREVALSIRHDAESGGLLKVRMAFGSAGYTLPIGAQFCMFCGSKIGETA